MSLRNELKTEAAKKGFQLFGISDIKELEDTYYPDGRGLMKPSEVMPNAKSVIILGMIIWDEGMNTAVSTAGSGDFSGGDNEYYNLYYEITETRAWRFSKWLHDEKGVDAVPSATIHLKVAAMLAGLGFIGHNTQIITPEYGPRVRWIAVLSTMVLKPDKPFTRNLCAEQEKCRNVSLCVKTCPYKAIITGPSQNVEPGKKVIYDKCVVAHEFDRDLDARWEKHINRIYPRTFKECTLCNLVCPYGKVVDTDVVPVKRGMAK
ncbi:MAG: epoxyqueuosine reductase [Candidatus Methanoplasma sp.]|jgi:epoxyqueuosine reductase|nr:epoxyqueuosine reductase [Candidatus Methanoplasma sp.]